MTPPSPDEDFGDEEALRTDVHIAINQAVDNVIENPGRTATEVEEEKLTYFAIKQFDIDLTYSWYLAGGNTKVGPNPQPDMTVSLGERFGTLEQETPLTDRIRDLRNFFETTTFFGDYDLRKVWYTDKFEFLYDYYEEFAPQEYRDLYLASIDFREKLWNLDDIITTESQNTTLGDFGGGGNNAILDPSDEEEMRYLVSDIHLELARVDHLSQTKELVSAGTDLIEKVLYQLTNLETTTREQRRILDELHDFFYYYIWKYPALLISADTASGPGADTLHQDHLLEFSNFDEVVEDELKQLTNWCYQADLLPEGDNLSSSDTANEKYLQYLMLDVVSE